jgi:hypothetical protein
MRFARLNKACVSVAACAAVITGVAGCSLLTVKTPDKPLSTRDLNARVLTRELSTQFVTAVEQCADDVVQTEKDPLVLQNSLRWEIAAVADSRRAAMQTAPLMSLLDSWALAVQMAAFTDAGARGGDLFGAHQQCVRKVSDGYAIANEELAHRLLSAREFSDYRGFVESYAREHPLEDLKFARASVVDLWSRQQGAEVKLIDSVGTIPQAMADVADRLQIYGDTVPSQVMWQTQLALQESGYSGGDVHAALKDLDGRLAALTAVADSAPEHVHDAVADLRRSLLEVIARLDVAAAATLARVGAERGAMLADLRVERQATLAAVDAQRKAITMDAARIANDIVMSSGDQARRLAREVLVLVIVLTALMLSLPFVAGYLVGRARHARK